jgi:hypothetical protein
MATLTNLSANLIIGDAKDDTKNVSVPIKTAIPPATPGEFSFEYTAPDIKQAKKFEVGSFLVWASDQLGASGAVNDLPEALRTFALAVLHLQFSTKGPFQITVRLGKESGGQWDPTWTPIPTLKLSVSDVTIEVDRQP